jgi:hypothetical protein
MQLGKKSKTTDMFERVRGDLGQEVDESPLVPIATPTAPEPAAASRASAHHADRDAIHISVNESISAKISREGIANSISITGDLTLRVTDPSLTKLRLRLDASQSHGASFRTHPNVDKGVFNSSKVIQLANQAKGFPVDNAVGVLKWRAAPKTDDSSALPIMFTVWVNKGSDGSTAMTVEYELTGGEPLHNVVVSIPYSGQEPSVDPDASCSLLGDCLEWQIGDVDDSNASGSLDFEANTDDENDFFPMQVRFSKPSTFMNIDVSLVVV